METTNNLDHRSHRRIHLGSQPPVVGIWVRDAASHKSVRLDAQAIDISAGGIGVSLTPHILAGEIVKVEYPIAGQEVKLPVISRVVWCQTDHTGSHAGLQFLS